MDSEEPSERVTAFRQSMGSAAAERMDVVTPELVNALHGVWESIRAAVEVMRESGYGRIDSVQAITSYAVGAAGEEVGWHD